ncbi:DUF6470 family protein [Marinicrinis lubricantis]|uniref:DUF6470 family protein n=1 Tax=Marinicrinis lubricantis TaxID=2086470 RepID=A0ABW1ITC6_9BACL
MTIPQIQIQQQFAKISIDPNLGHYEMKQNHQTLSLKTTGPRLEIHSPSGELHINQDRVWDAMALGDHLKVMKRLYDQAESIALQGIARRVQEGDQLAAIHKKTNAIKNNAMDAFAPMAAPRISGPAAYDNIDIEYIARKPVIEVHAGHVENMTPWVRPEIMYHRRDVEISMAQYAKVTIIPPQIDMKL